MEIQELLKLSVTKHASDLHVLPELKPLLRIDGLLTPSKEFDILTPQDTKRLIYSLMTEEEQKKFQKNLVIELALSFPNIGNFRASAFHQLHGVAGVFRIIPEKIPTFEELELPSVLKQSLVMPHGLVLATGPTGSGKSTTLAAMVDYINSYRVCNIFTIEDPIEFIHENKRSVINQLQVGRDTHDFASALRSSLRQDPNVILLGELRDLETMRLALIAAETGHLVMATMHASSAALAINRFTDVFPTEEKNMVRTLLSETMQCIIFQKLVKRVSGGRVAAFEVMLTTPAIRHYIRQDMPSHMESSMQTSGDKGMCTLDQYLQDLVKKRVITALVASNATSEIKKYGESSKRNEKETKNTTTK